MSTINKVAHGLVASQRVTFDTLVGGSPIDVDTIYYVLAAGLAADTFQISEIDEGTPLTFATLTSANMAVVPETVTDPSTSSYSPITGPAEIMAPPVPVPTPSLPTLTSASVSGIVRLRIVLNGAAEAKVRSWEVEVTSKFTGAVADWSTPQVFNLPERSTDLSMPALGSTIYAVRVRAQDVYGQFSSYCAESTATTVAGSDSLTASIALLANDVQDLIITETKILPGSITTPLLRAGAVTADILAATIVLASLLKTANSGRRIELDVDGIRLINTDESLLVRIPTNGDPVYVKGEISADSLISQTSAEFRTAASLAGSTVMTLQNGISAPTAVPTLTASVDALTLTSAPGSIAAAAGIGYDSAASSYWIACDPTVSPYYVAQEFNGTTGALIRSIPSTGSTSTTTTTLGSTSHVADTADGISGSTNSHLATPLTMPRAGRVTKVAAYFAGRLGSCSARVGIWDDVSGTGNLLRESATFTASSGGATTLGASDLYNKTLTSVLSVTNGQVLYVGFRHTIDAEGFQFDKDDGAGKTTYGGDGTTADGTGWGTYDSAGKPNVYITYEYDTDTRLETRPNVGVCTDGTHVYTLDDTGVVWKYLRSDMSYVSKSVVQTAITGTKSKAGLFYDATSGELSITTTTGTGAGVYPKIVRVNRTTLALSSAVYTAATGSTFSGTTDTFRGGARLNDPLNASAATYWLATTSAVYAYTFAGVTLTDTANRSFGLSTTVGDGLTHDGTVFRGFDSASPTKVHKFSDWDWTSASAVYWVGYAWYDNIVTTHETVIGPRASLTLRRRERLQVQSVVIPTGGVDDPNNVRIYMLPNGSDPSAGSFKLQVGDALTSRYLTTYASGGAADGAGLAFAAGTAAQLKSAATGWNLKGDGTIAQAGVTTFTGTTYHPGRFDSYGSTSFGAASFPAGPTTDDVFYRTDLQMWFAYDGTRWLSTQVFEVQLGSGAGNTSYAATTSNMAWQSIDLYGGSDAYLIDTIAFFFVNTGGTALGASHSWALAFEKAVNSSATLTSVGSATINSGTNGSRKTVAAVNALLNNGTVHNGFRINLTKVGTPGSTFVAGKVTYRVVAT